MRNERGFTLIELIIVMVVLAIMAALAIPKFIDIRAEAKASAIQGSLGGVRSAIANYRATQVAKGATPELPTVALLEDGLTVMTEPIPKNPYDVSTAPTNDVEGTTSTKSTQPCMVGATLTPSTKAWCYNTTNGAFWANTNTTGVGENAL